MSAPYKPTPCPKCGEASECVDWCEVDIGVGLQTWDPEYRCPTHGAFAFKSAPIDELGVLRSSPEPVFRDEQT